MRLLTEEGYLELDPQPFYLVNNTGTYYYSLRDHLGSVRYIFDERGQNAGYTHYYGFGMEDEMEKYGYNEAAPGVPGREKYTGQELLADFGLNLYDYGWRNYDPATGRFTTMDPLAERYYSVSPYAYCGNNPINRIDLDGREWFEDNDGTRQFNPDLNKNNQSDILKQGQTYIGPTDVVKDKDGNVIENYRKDGSIMYTNETSGYARIWNNSKKTGNEEMGVITEKGVLVLPSWNNDPRTSKVAEYGYSWKNGNINDTDGNSFNTLGTFHLHPDPDGDKTASIEDVNYFSKNVPNKPYFIVMADKKISSYMSYPRSGYGNITMPSYNGASFSFSNLTSGKYPLTLLLNHNRKR